MSTSEVMLFLLVLFITCSAMDAAGVGPYAECGHSKGCFFAPGNCTNSVDTCDFILTWVHNNDSITFEFVASVSDNPPWAAFGLNDAALMPGASVVDCVVNASDSNKVEIQMSHNGGYDNYVLEDKLLGLNGSLAGEYKDGHITCSFVRLKQVDPSAPESKDVMNLTTPHYVLLARGKASIVGVKYMHSDDPVKSVNVVSFLTYSNVTLFENRPLAEKVHAIMAIIAWMVLASVGIVTARYMKPRSPYVQHTLWGSAAWFQVHRILLVSTFIFTLIAVLVMFAFKNWNFLPGMCDDLMTCHPLLGFITACIVTLNPVLAILRPSPRSAYRPVFRWLHGFILGHGVHLLSVVTIYFGVRFTYIGLPEWCHWVVIAFAAWRLLADVMFSILPALCDHDNALLKSPSSDVQSDDDSETNNRAIGWRSVVLFIYFTGSVGMALSLIIAVVQR